MSSLFVAVFILHGLKWLLFLLIFYIVSNESYFILGIMDYMF